MNRKNSWILPIIGGAIPTAIILSLYFGLSETVFIPLVIPMLLVFLSGIIWLNANKKSTGSEWWQDEEASGWRGY